ncbi:MAG: ligase-associated DNA damage response endonuclease PdeM [Geminicoccaceae bacterium]
MNGAIAFALNGRRVLADPSGALWLADEAMLIVADLHLEKGSAFAGKGIALPPYDTRATLARLELVVAGYQPRTVVCLGDSFHDCAGPARLVPDERIALRRLTGSCDWLWLAGNHDPVPPRDLGGRSAVELDLGDLALRHEPLAGPAAGEIAGHLHPKASVLASGRRLSRRCFLTDGCRVILPAFGAFTGGLDVLDAAFDGLMQPAFHALLLGERKLHAVSARRLHADMSRGGGAVHATLRGALGRPTF